MAGPAVGALVAGIAALLVSFVVGFLAVVDLAMAADETVEGGRVGLLAGGAFALLAGFLGLAGVGLGVIGIQRTRAAARRGGEPEVTGRGMAIAGLAVAGLAVLIVVCGLALSVVLAL